MESEGYQNFLRNKIVAVCEGIMRDEIGIIAGSRQLVSLYSEMIVKNDSDFMIFIAIESETDHLPVGQERNNLSVDALKKREIEILEFELASKNEAMLACQKLISRFSAKD